MTVEIIQCTITDEVLEYVEYSHTTNYFQMYFT